MFLDKGLKKSVTAIDFGWIEAGRAGELTLYVLNDSCYNMRNLKFHVDDKD